MIIVMESLRETICKNFNRILDERPDIKARQVSEAAGVHVSMIYKYKEGENIPEPEKMEAIAKLFNVDVMEFYKIGSGVISMQPSRALRKYLVIPDKVVELASEVESTDEAWDTVISALEIARDRVERKKAAIK